MTKLIYKVTNRKTSKVYIGATSDSIENRKKDQIKKSDINSKRKLYKAIATYRPEAFK